MQTVQMGQSTRLLDTKMGVHTKVRKHGSVKWESFRIFTFNTVDTKVRKQETGIGWSDYRHVPVGATNGEVNGLGLVTWIPPGPG